MAAYDDFAWFYNRYWADEFHALAFPILERIWLPRLPSGGSVLDICCGTGYLAGLLEARGFRVTGVDESAAMIGCARGNAPGSRFEVARAEAFRLPARFDGAVCTYDSLNHLAGRAELDAALRNIAAALRPGAPLAFDILLEEAYQTHWGENFAVVREDHVLLITGSAYDFRQRRARCTITMFRKIDGAWRRADVTIEEQCYARAEIDAALGGAGFGEILRYDARDLGMGGQLGAGRAFYVAARI